MSTEIHLLDNAEMTITSLGKLVAVVIAHDCGCTTTTVSDLSSGAHGYVVRGETCRDHGGKAAS